MARGVVAMGLVAIWTTVAGAQTPELASDVEEVIQTLARAGVATRGDLVDALETAWVAERDEEYALLRGLGVTPTDAEFDAAWQNQPGRAPQFVPYDVEEWTTDVVRSWARVHPRAAFTWVFAVRSRHDLVLPRRSAFERVTTDWARMSAEAGREAEAEALAIRDETLREEAVIGVIRGNILRGDPRRVAGLLESVSDPARRGEIQALYERYIR
jgi:hypothetical protein